MNKDIYSYSNLGEDHIYIFVSEGPQGTIKKAVVIDSISDDLDHFFEPLYNLAFGDWLIREGRAILDDSVRTGNGDMPKVIATVAAIAMEFLCKHPNCSLVFQGYIDQKSVRLGKNQRNTLYQRAIDSNWDDLTARFNFWGISAAKIETYVPRRTYDRILVKLK